MKTKILAILTVLCMSSILSAATIEAGSPACISEDLFNQLTQAVKQNDEHSATWLAKNGCIITRKEFPVTVLSSSLTGVLRVRAYADNGVVLELWVPKGRIKE